MTTGVTMQKQILFLRLRCHNRRMFPNIRSVFTKCSREQPNILLWGHTMTTSQSPLRSTAETVVGVLFSAGFMLVWLCCWPLYRLG
jgi:hypothetical protein